MGAFRNALRTAILSLGISVFGLGCQTAPTDVKEESQVLIKDASGLPPEMSEAESKLKNTIILLDARPAFAAAVSPVKQAQTLDWRDFTRRVAPNPTALEGDLFFHARRLARMGISPESKVMILGRGLDGDGEEGRLAWTLRYLGIPQVQFASVEDFRPQIQKEDSPRPAEAPVWKPSVNEGLLETRASLVAKIKSNQRFYFVELTAKNQTLPWPDAMQFGAAQRLKFTQSDFLKMSHSNDLAVKALFSETEKMQIVVIDPSGEMSGYATAKLRDLGLNASCACGGWRDYVVTPKDLK